MGVEVGLDGEGEDIRSICSDEREGFQLQKWEERENVCVVVTSVMCEGEKGKKEK